MENQIKEAILNVLNSNNVLTLATTGGEYTPWILSVYFASEGLNIYFFLEQSGKSLQNVKINDSAAIAISENDAMKDFIQAQGKIVLLSQTEENKVREMLVKKMPWFQTYTPVTPVKLDVSKFFISSFQRQWFPAKILAA